MHIADGVEMLEISSTVMGRPNVIRPMLLHDADTAVLVDTGYPGQLALLREAMAQVGVALTQLRVVILTHHDVDHIGNLPGLLAEAPQPVEVVAGAADQPFIQGEQPSPRFAPDALERMLSALPPEFAEQRRQAFEKIKANPPTAPVNHPARDGEVLPYSGGITVITTPGHTPGHICLYHAPSKTLIAGDALTIVDGQLQRPAPQIDLNRDEAGRSLAKLLAFDIATVISYHGGIFRGHIHQRIAALAGDTDQGQ